jgi:hypothetical protein
MSYLPKGNNSRYAAEVPSFQGAAKQAPLLKRHVARGTMKKVSCLEVSADSESKALPLGGLLPFGMELLIPAPQALLPPTGGST